MCILAAMAEPLLVPAADCLSPTEGSSLSVYDFAAGFSGGSSEDS